MNIYVQYTIKNDLNSMKFLKEYSYWYKYLNRNPMYLKEFKDDMRKRYNLTFEDKLDRFSKNLDRISNFIDIFS